MKQAVVVFGAYGGIGSQLCRRLSSHGANLLMAGRDDVRLAALASELRGETLTLDATDLYQVMSANLKTAFAVLHSATRAMAQSGGSIVLISSATARIGLPNHEAISAAKAGVEGLALAVAASYASKGIRINCVAPGMTRTSLTETLLKNELMEKASAGMRARAYR